MPSRAAPSGQPEFARDVGIVMGRLMAGLKAGVVDDGLVDDALRIMDHPEFGSLGPDVQAEVLLLTGLGMLDRGRNQRQPTDLRQSITLLDQALSMRQEGSIAWAGVAGNLGLALTEAYDLERSLRDLRRAIDLLSAAVEVFGDSGQAATAQHNLGCAYRALYDESGKIDSLNAAITWLERSCATAQEPEIRAGHRNSLASALRAQFRHCNDRSSLSQAVAHWRLALAEVDDDSSAWLSYAVGLANAVLDEAESDGDGTLSEESIRLFRRVLAAQDPASDAWTKTASNLANALWTHYRLLGERAPLQEAQELFSRMLSDIDDASPLRATVMANAAAALHELYESTGVLSALEESVRLGELLVAGEELTALPASDAPRAVGRQHNLAVSLVARYKRLGRLEDLSHAIELYQSVLQVSPGGTDGAASSDSLGNALQLRFDRTGDTADLEQAVASHQQAVGSYEGSVLDQALARSNLGVALTALASHLEQPTSLERAIVELRRALADVPLRSPTRVRVLTALADSLAVRATSGTEAKVVPGDVEEASGAYRRAAQLGLRLLPEQAIGASVSWGDWASSRSAWAEAVEAYRYGIRAVAKLFTTHELAPHKEIWLRAVQGLPEGAAFALAQQNELRSAVGVIERGRVNLLREALRHRESEAVEGSAGGRPVRRRLGQTVVYLVAARMGGLALVVPPPGTGRTGPIRVDLPGLSDELVHARATELWSAYEHRREPGSRWPDVLDRTCRWAWDVVISRLDDAGVLEASLVLVAAGAMGSIPLHAAWTTAGANGERRWLLDTCAVSYAPSGGFLRGLPAQVRRATPESGIGSVRAGVTVVVAKPQPSKLPALSYTDLELQGVKEGSGRTTSFVGPRATRRLVVPALRHADVFHVACHGLSDPAEPRQSAIYLAGDEPLTVAEVLELSLGSVTLAVLSACESGITGEAVPDELIGLPSALLQAGARTVLATSWSVPDLATALLVTEFYRLWRRGESPAVALQRAQRWLLGATNAELLERFPSVFEAKAPGGGLARRIWLGARPASSATEWAAFTVMGDGFW